MKEELSALLADFRALLDSDRGRGALDLPADAVSPAVGAMLAPLPSAPPSPASPARAPVTASSPVVAPTVPRVAAPAVAASAWAAVAAVAREVSDDAIAHGDEGLRRIREDLGDCRRCGLCKDRRNIVFGGGRGDAALMVIGEGPGHEEDLSGEPFVGPAGQMLDKMLLNVVGVSREQVYIANIVKCRPPGNRNPEPDEIAACRPYLERQIQAVRPKILLVLGSVALKALLASSSGIMKARGTWHDYRGIPVMPTFHPAYLLRNPEEKRKTFDDLKALKEKYVTLGVP